MSRANVHVRTRSCFRCASCDGSRTIGSRRNRRPPAPRLRLSARPKKPRTAPPGTPKSAGVRDEADRARMAREEEEQRAARGRTCACRRPSAAPASRARCASTRSACASRCSTRRSTRRSRRCSTVAGLLVLIAGGVGYKMYSQHQTELAVERAERERISTRRRARTAPSCEAQAGRDREEHERPARQGQDRGRAQRIRIAAAEAKAAAQAQADGRATTTTKTDSDADKPVVPTIKKRENQRQSPRWVLDPGSRSRS